MLHEQTQLIVGWRKEFPFNFVEKHTEDKQIWSTHTLFCSYPFIKKKINLDEEEILQKSWYIFMKGRANLILSENILHLHLSLPDSYCVLFSPAQPVNSVDHLVAENISPTQLTPLTSPVLQNPPCHCADNAGSQSAANYIPSCIRNFYWLF